MVSFNYYKLGTPHCRVCPVTYRCLSSERKFYTGQLAKNYTCQPKFIPSNQNLYRPLLNLFIKFLTLSIGYDSIPMRHQCRQLRPIVYQWSSVEVDILCSVDYTKAQLHLFSLVFKLSAEWSVLGMSRPGHSVSKILSYFVEAIVRFLVKFGRLLQAGVKLTFTIGPPRSCGLAANKLEREFYSGLE